ncbi:MAG: histidine phosphatase family protein [Oscillospiraceae bacterium]|nr:histidine phosphatase family protein [Oscillospiraceae bacterium]
MKTIYFVRHGESVWNTLDKICGQNDSPLTDRGREQARATGAQILASGIQADIILYSSLSRAAETAQIISEMTGIPAMEEPRLMEQCFGRFEGTSPRNAPEFVEAKKRFADSYDGGESMFRLAQRIYNLLDDLKTDPRTCILVAHNGIARVINSYFYDMTNEEYASFGVKNASVTEFTFSE